MKEFRFLVIDAIVACFVFFCMLLALIVLLVVASGDAHAEEKTFTMNPPTEYTNGDPLDVADIEQTAIYCGPTQASYSPVVNEPGFDGELVADFDDGGYYCVATVTVGGNESAFSNEVFFLVDRTPSAPEGLSVD